MLESALQTAAVAIIIIDEAGIIRSVNPATATMFGFSETELVGRNVSKLMPEPFRSRHDGYIRHHLKTGERKIIGIGRQVMALRSNGAIFPAHLAVSTFAADGRRYFTGIIHDLSEQRVTADLREQSLLQKIFNQLPDAVLIVDREGAITLCNPAVTRVFGYPPEELIGHLLIIYPLWLGMMPALLKAFFEQAFRPGFAFRAGDSGWSSQLGGRSARIVVTMGMPALVYRWYFGAHGLKSLERSILRLVGIGPIRETLIGMIGTASEAKRKAWIAKLRDLGRAGA